MIFFINYQSVKNMEQHRLDILLTFRLITSKLKIGVGGWGLVTIALKLCRLLKHFTNLVKHVKQDNIYKIKTIYLQINNKKGDC